MTESIKNPHPNWQDISLADIDACIESGKLREALMFAKFRLEGIRAMPAEIESARKESIVTSDADWHETANAFTKEIAQLKSIIVQLQSEL